MVEHPANITFGSKPKPPSSRAHSPNLIGNASEQTRVPNFAPVRPPAAAEQNVAMKNEEEKKQNQRKGTVSVVQFTRHVNSKNELIFALTVKGKSNSSVKPLCCQVKSSYPNVATVTWTS